MLIVDTCGAEGGVGLADGLRLLAERVLPGRETQERLMVALGEVLAEAGRDVADVDVLAVVTGPGSFTGVRIGLAAVKGLAEAIGKPVVALSRLQVLAAQRSGNVEAWLDAGRGDVFVGRYAEDGTGVEQMLHGVDAVAAASGRVVVVEEKLLELMPSAELVEAVGVREALPLAVAKSERGAFADVALLDANYLRVPDAELALRARMAAASQ